MKPSGTEEIEKFLDNFFKKQCIQIIEFDRVIAKITRQTVRQYKMKKSADLIHLATALRVKADFFNTTDEKLINKFSDRNISLPDYPKPVILQTPSLIGHTLSLL